MLGLTNELIGIVNESERAEFENKYGRFVNFVYSNGIAKIYIPQENKREQRNLEEGWGFIPA